MRLHRQLPLKQGITFRLAIICIIYVHCSIIIVSTAAFQIASKSTYCISCSPRNSHCIPELALRFNPPHCNMDATDVCRSYSEKSNIVGPHEKCSLDEAYTSRTQPLYITIGPPCSGKTTWIKRQSANISAPDIYDVCIDDQPGVYYALPTSWFVPNLKPSGDGSLNQVLSSKSLTKDTLLFGKTIQDRIMEGAELMIVLSRLANLTLKEEFQIALKSSTIPSHIQALVNGVEDFIDVANADNRTTGITLPNTVDFFVREAIFCPSPTHLLNDCEDVCYSALERTDRLLNDQPSSSPVSWGNTNTRAKEYSNALSIAEKMNRPVYFAVFYDNEMTIPQLPSGQESICIDLFDMFVENSYEELIHRNIDRLIRTGRYIPTNVIWDMKERTIELVDTAFESWCQHEVTNSDSVSRRKLRFHQSLAQLAGYEMNDDRLVRHLSFKRKQNALDYPYPLGGGSVNQQPPWDHPPDAARGYNHRYFTGAEDPHNGLNNAPSYRPSQRGRFL